MSSNSQQTEAIHNQRLQTTLEHLNPVPGECGGKIQHKPYTPPMEKELKWNGWGYEDTAFVLNDEGKIQLTGNKYWLSGKVFPKFRKFIEGQMEGSDADTYNPPQETIQVPPAIINEEFLKDIDGKYSRIDFDRLQCVRHAHGHTAQEVYRLRYGTFDRIPDVVIWPSCHDQIQTILNAANQHNVVIIPFGGGTSVTEALICPANEKRMIVSLDMRHMNRIKWVDRESLLACIEAGAVGKELEARLTAMGLCLGHEPDSHEFSTIGGWVATRASGMKKNVYGNIEDLVIHVKVATPVGTLDRNCNVPRMSSGPDLQQMILGSEGILGVITEVTVKVQPLPEKRAYGAIAFKDFETGVAFLREIALKRLQPASIRLMDNQQFQLGQHLTPEENPQLTYIKEKLKNLFLTQFAKFDLDQMCACTLLFEGRADQVDHQQSEIYSIASKYGGIKAGEKAGMKGYFLTYMIAYLRDYGFGYWLVGESFETSVPWSNVLTLCNRVKERVVRSGEERGLPYRIECSYRVTQLYDTGAAVYFYFGFIFRGVDDPLQKFADIEADARDEILACGGSISHHHGVGKLRKHWLRQTVSPVGVEILRAVKKSFDPNNILGNQNLIDV